jgi:hypothetical protein
LNSQISAASRASATASKEITKHAATEDITESLKNIFGISKLVESGARKPFMAKTVISGSLIRVSQHLIGLGCFFKLLLGFMVVGISVRMIFES